MSLRACRFNKRSHKKSLEYLYEFNDRTDVHSPLGNFWYLTTMASAAFLRMTRKRPLISLGAAAASLTTASAFGMEVYADRQERQIVHYHHGKTTSEVEEALAAGVGLPRAYDREQIRSYWLQRPVSVVARIAQIVTELGPVVTKYYVHEKVLPVLLSPTEEGIDLQELQQEQQLRLQSHAEQFREALTNLGPAWVKG